MPLFHPCLRAPWRRWTVVAVSGACLCLPAQAQLLAYANAQEILGAAAVSPSATVQVVERLLHACADLDSSLRNDGDNALQQLKHRQQGYLEENLATRKQLESLYTSPQAKQALNDSLTTQLPQLMQSQYDMFYAPIKTARTRQQKSALCQDYITAVTQQKFDLRQNDPTLAKFLDERIKGRQFGDKLPAAKALLGRWRHVGTARSENGVSAGDERSSGNAVLEYKDDLTWSMVDGAQRSSGIYQWTDIDRIAQTIFFSSYPAPVGKDLVKKISVTDGRLEIVSEYRAADTKKEGAADSTGQKLTTVVTRFVRMQQ